MMQVSAHVPAIAAHTVFAAAMDDMSAEILRQYLQAGFREVEWLYGFEPWQNTELWRQQGSVCPACFALDGQRFKIEWLLQNMHHDAPKYSMSHVNCACKLVPKNRTEELLDYSETMEVAPSDVSDTLKDRPISLDEVSPEARPQMGLPAEQNDFTDIEWQWDATRNEFVPLKTLQTQSETGEYVYDATTGTFIPGGS